MARPLRVEFPGAIYHVTARGNEKRAIFRDDDDRRRWLEALDQLSVEYGIKIHGYCLMPNHYHLLLETPRANLSRAMAWFQTTYTVRFNRRHRRSGHLFQGRFKAHVVDADDYARQLICYVHLNPVRPRDKGAIIAADKRANLDRWPWSSHPAYLGKVAAPRWLSMDWLHHFGRTPVQARRTYRKLIDETFGKRAESPWEELQWGLALGNEKFQKRMRKVISRKPGGTYATRHPRPGEERIRRTTTTELAAREEEPALKAWIRVHLGGERRIDVARSLGYKDGSAITQMLKRLKTRRQKDRRLNARITTLERETQSLLSKLGVDPVHKPVKIATVRLR